MNRLIVILFCFLLISITIYPQNFKTADLSGSWYPSDPGQLKKQIQEFLDQAQSPSLEGEIIALIAPHAGISYSGETAGHTFKVLSDKKINQIIVVGFSHRKNYDGIAVLDKQGYKTPLGVLDSDRGMVENIVSKSDKIFVRNDIFQEENSVELLIPFIQVSLDNPKALLLAIGKQSKENCQILGDALYEIVKDNPKTVIVASTDMSHYLPRRLAKVVDLGTSEMITKMDQDYLIDAVTGQNKMCGSGAVVATMIAAKKLGADKFKVLHRANSSKTENQDEKVVGYLSGAFIRSDKSKNIKEENMEQLLNDEQRAKLLKLARDTINLQIKKAKKIVSPINDPALQEIYGVFVTLHKQDNLRGCIGNIIGKIPLDQGVIEMAIAASTQDPRFPSVTKSEIDDLELEISVLSPLKKIDSPAEIILGKHGVLVKKGFKSGVYLPQVADETGWSKEEFMSSLCMHKAGIPANSWKSGDCEIYVFTAEVFSEE